MSIDDIKDHRRGSSFYVQDIIEFKEEHSKYYPEIKDFSKYLGYWITNSYIWDDNYGVEDEPCTLTRVEKKEKITYQWIPLI